VIKLPDIKSESYGTRITIVSFILLCWGIVTYIYSIYNTEVIINISASNTFGLLEELNILFMPSIILVVISIILQTSFVKDRYFVASLLILSVMIWGTPVFVETYPRMWDTYEVGYIANEIARNGGFSLSWAENPFLRYIEFPLSLILYAIILSLNDIELITFLKYYPIIFTPLMFISFYVFFKKLSRNIEDARIASLIFLLVNSAFYNHASPQSLALIIYLLFLTLVLDSKINVSKVSLLVIILIALTMMHPTTSAINIIILILLSISYFISKEIDFEKAKQYFEITFLSIICFTFWFIYNAFYTFNIMIPLWASHLQNILMIDAIKGGVSANTILLPQKIRASFFFTGMTISSIYTLYLWYKKRNEFHIYFAILGSVFLMMLLVHNVLGGTFGERVLFVGYIIISVAVAMIFHGFRKKIPNNGHIIHKIILFLPLVFLINTSTFYYSESIYYYSGNIINGYSFVLDHNDEATYALTYSMTHMESPIKVFLALDTRKVNMLLTKKTQMVPWSEILSDLKRGGEFSLPQLICLSDKTKKIAIQFGYQKEYKLLQNFIKERYSKIYDSPAIKTYSWTFPTTLLVILFSR